MIKTHFWWSTSWKQIICKEIILVRIDDYLKHMWLPIIIFMIRLLKSCQKKFKMCTNAFVCTCIDITQKLLYLNPKWKCCCYDVLIKINSVYEHFGYLHLLTSSFDLCQKPEVTKKTFFLKALHTSSSFMILRSHN